MNDFLTLDNQLCFALYEVSSEFTKLYSKALQSFGLTYPQYLVLLALWEKDGITAKQLGEKLNLGTGTLTPMIKRMSENGWVEKVRSSADERNVFIYLQEKAVTEKTKITNKIENEVTSCKISVDEYKQLMMNLRNLQMKLRNQT